MSLVFDSPLQDVKQKMRMQAMAFKMASATSPSIEQLQKADLDNDLSPRQAEHARVDREWDIARLTSDILKKHSSFDSLKKAYAAFKRHQAKKNNPPAVKTPYINKIAWLLRNQDQKNAMVQLFNFMAVGAYPEIQHWYTKATEGSQYGHTHTQWMPGDKLHAVFKDSLWWTSGKEQPGFMSVVNAFSGVIGLRIRARDTNSIRFAAVRVHEKDGNKRKALTKTLCRALNGHQVPFMKVGEYQAVTLWLWFDKLVNVDVAQAVVHSLLGKHIRANKGSVSVYPDKDLAMVVAVPGTRMATLLDSGSLSVKRATTLPEDKDANGEPKKNTVKAQVSTKVDYEKQFEAILHWTTRADHLINPLDFLHRNHKTRCRQGGCEEASGSPSLLPVSKPKVSRSPVVSLASLLAAVGGYSEPPLGVPTRSTYSVSCSVLPGSYLMGGVAEGPKQADAPSKRKQSKSYESPSASAKPFGKRTIHDPNPYPEGFSRGCRDGQTRELVAWWVRTGKLKTAEDAKGLMEDYCKQTGLGTCDLKLEMGFDRAMAASAAYAVSLATQYLKRFTAPDSSKVGSGRLEIHPEWADLLEKKIAAAPPEVQFFAHAFRFVVRHLSCHKGVGPIHHTKWKKLAVELGLAERRYQEVKRACIKFLSLVRVGSYKPKDHAQCWLLGWMLETVDCEPMASSGDVSEAGTGSVDSQRQQIKLKIGPDGIWEARVGGRVMTAPIRLQRRGVSVLASEPAAYADIDKLRCAMTWMRRDVGDMFGCPYLEDWWESAEGLAMAARRAAHDKLMSSKGPIWVTGPNGARQVYAWQLPQPKPEHGPYGIALVSAGEAWRYRELQRLLAAVKKSNAEKAKLQAERDEALMAVDLDKLVANIKTKFAVRDSQTANAETMPVAIGDLDESVLVAVPLDPVVETVAVAVSPKTYGYGDLPMLSKEEQEACQERCRLAFMALSVQERTQVLPPAHTPEADARWLQAANAEHEAERKKLSKAWAKDEADEKRDRLRAWRGF